ncbi:MAG: hypothetical protein EOM26_07450 [Alphaproteobacteria bacterium]|nr:hypothetical protein [Alphaproteobacteria bacterium]
MHDTRLAFILFDERSFRDGPVLLDDGAYSHCLIPDEEDYLPVLKSAAGGNHSLVVSTEENADNVLLVFSLYSEDQRKVAIRKLCVSGRACRMPTCASEEEREEFRSSIYASACQRLLSDWFADVNEEFFLTLGLFSRTAVEQTYGDLLTSYDGKAETFDTVAALHCTTH